MCYIHNISSIIMSKGLKKNHSTVDMPPGVKILEGFTEYGFDIWCAIQ